MNKCLTCFFILLISIESQAQTDEDSTQRIKLAAIPVINYSNTVGASFGVLASTFYKIRKSDLNSPSSSSGVFGIYSTNNTYFMAVFQQLYLKEDSWRITAAAGTGKVNSQYWH